MVRSTLLISMLALAAIPVSLAQQGAPPYSTDNSQNACVEYGSCATAGGNGVITATQNAPVTAPAGTPALATYTTLDSGFISSLAAAGASSAFVAQGGGSASRAAAVTVASSARGSTASGGNGGSGGSGGNGGSSATATMGLGGLGSGSSNAGSATAGDVKGKVVGLVAVGAGMVLGGVMLL